jgi:hypothetical protein
MGYYKQLAIELEGEPSDYTSMPMSGLEFVTHVNEALSTLGSVQDFSDHDLGLLARRTGSMYTEMSAKGKILGIAHFEDTESMTDIGNAYKLDLPLWVRAFDPEENDLRAIVIRAFGSGEDKELRRI